MVRCLGCDASHPLPARGMRISELERWAQEVYEEKDHPLHGVRELDGARQWSLTLGVYGFEGAGSHFTHVLYKPAQISATLHRPIPKDGVPTAWYVKSAESYEHAALHVVAEGSDTYLYLRFPLVIEKVSQTLKTTSNNKKSLP